MKWNHQLKFIQVMKAVLLGSFLALPAQAQVTVAIGTAKDPNLAAQLQIASAMGYFSEVGIEATVSDFPSGGDMMAAFVGGSVQMATAGSTPVLLLASRPYPIAIVSQISDISGAQQLLVHDDVNTLEDLYGKKIGMLKGTASEALFSSVVKDYGLDAEKFETVNLGPTEMLQAFVRKQVDAVALWEPHSTRAREAANGKTLVSGTQSFIPGKEESRRVYGDHAVLFTSEEFAKNNKETVEKVITAIAKASDYLRTNRKEAVALLADAFQLTPDQMDKIADVNEYTLTINDQMIDDMNSLAGFLASRGKVAEGTDVRNWINTDALSAVNPDLVDIK